MVGATITDMDVFDGADYASLLPRRCKALIAGIVIVGILASPSHFRRWYVAQCKRHVQHVVAQFMTPLVDGSPVPSRR